MKRVHILFTLLIIVLNIITITTAWSNGHTISEEKLKKTRFARQLIRENDNSNGDRENKLGIPGLPIPLDFDTIKKVLDLVISVGQHLFQEGASQISKRFALLISPSEIDNRLGLLTKFLHNGPNFKK